MKTWRARLRFRRQFEQRGDALASLLNRRIDALADDDQSRSEIIEAMATAAGISPSTVTQILRAEIGCPPRDRLADFAEALDISLNSLLAAGRRDGCEYE